jgi:hypothetical protein
MCLQAYFKLKAQEVEPDTVQGSLEDVYGRDIVEEVLNEFSDRRNSFNGLKLPACSFCLLCPAIQQCKFGRWMEITTKLQDQMKAHPIDQKRMVDLSNHT